MKNKILTVISTFMLIAPWTIFLLRTQSWALESPTAEIIIISYALFMIISGLFTIIIYIKEKVQNNWMKICLICNSIYSIVGITVCGLYFY